MANAMFGVIVSGRQVQTNFEFNGATQFLLTIPDADNINHVVVFLTGATLFPENTAGLVYFSWPDPFAPPSFQLLGCLSNEKPSAIFKISNLKKNGEGESATNFPFGTQAISHVAQIGISIEPINIVAQQNQVFENVNASTKAKFVEFTEKTVQYLFNYVCSFSVTPAQALANPNEPYIPMSAIKNWYETFRRKLELNPNFWQTLN